MKVTLADGAIVEGTQAQIETIMRALGTTVDNRLYYNSNSRGLVRIADMDTQHIKNAIRKMYREWADNLPVYASTNDFLSTLLNGMSRNQTMLGLVTELQTRK